MTDLKSACEEILRLSKASAIGGFLCHDSIDFAGALRKTGPAIAQAFLRQAEEIEKGKQWNQLLELELSNLRSLKPTCGICEQLMEPRGEDGTDFVCAHCDRAYRESQRILHGYIDQARAHEEYIRKLGVLLGCADGDDKPEDRIEETQETIRRKSEALKVAKDALERLLAESEFFTHHRCSEVGDSYGEGTDEEQSARLALASIRALEGGE